MSKKTNYKAGTGISLGIGLGTTFGIIFDNLALWLSVGVVLGLAYDAWAKKKADTEEQNETEDL